MYLFAVQMMVSLTVLVQIGKLSAVPAFNPIVLIRIRSKASGVECLVLYYSRLEARFLLLLCAWIDDCQMPTVFFFDKTYLYLDQEDVQRRTKTQTHTDTHK